MRKIVVAEFMSLDGVMQAPGGADEDTEGGFAHGGWTLPYWHDDIGTQLFAEISTAEAFLYGRKTWQTHGAAFEPMTGDAFADLLNATPKYVVSRTLTEATAWRNSTLIADDVVKAIRALKAQPGSAIYVDGSSVLVHTLAQHDLVDEYNLLVYPIALGGGKKVFPKGQKMNLRLIESRPFPSGVVLLRYAVERPT